MFINESAENYLETILMLKERLGTVRSIDIARELGFSKPSISHAMKNLRESEHITVAADGTIDLTESGSAIAENIYGRHKRLSGGLIAHGVDPATAYRDACKMEHDLSEQSFLVICRLLEQNNSF